MDDVDCIWWIEDMGGFCEATGAPCNVPYGEMPEDYCPSGEYCQQDEE